MQRLRQTRQNNYFQGYKDLYDASFEKEKNKQERITRNAYQYQPKDSSNIQMVKRSISNPYISRKKKRFFQNKNNNKNLIFKKAAK
jgi:hypothetical protein